MVALKRLYPCVNSQNIQLFGEKKKVFADVIKHVFFFLFRCMHCIVHDQPHSSIFSQEFFACSGRTVRAEDVSFSCRVRSEGAVGFQRVPGAWEDPRAPFPHLTNYTVKLHAIQHKISNQEPNGWGYNQLRHLPSPF